MLLQACINGMRPKAEHSAIPVTVAEAVEAAVAAVRAGAGEVHVHTRSANGAESLEPDDVAAWVAALRTACPGTAIGITTNERIIPDLARRRTVIDDWRVVPDFASVNLGEADAPSIIGRMADRGVLAEAGLATVDDARRYVAERARGMWVKRVLIEPDAADSVDAVALAEAILAVLASVSRAAPILMHGFEDGAWPVLRRARELGFSVRMGLEDSLVASDGSVAVDNAALVRDALRL